MKTRIPVHCFSTAFVAALIGYGAVTIAAGEDFPALVKRLQQEKPKFAKRQQAMLAERYDLADRPAKGDDHVARQAGAGGRARQVARRA